MHKCRCCKDILCSPSVCACFRQFAWFCLHAFCLPLCCMTWNTLHTSHTHYTLSPSVCIMFLALPLFLFAGRAKAEPARQTTTKRRKRKNSASSANSSVGTTASKKRSPATNFSLSSQVPVSISSTPVCLLFFISFFLWLHVHVCRVTHRQPRGIPNGIAAIRFNLFAQKRKKTAGGGGEGREGMWDKETSRDLYENISPWQTKRKYIKYHKEWHKRH